MKHWSSGGAEAPEMRCLKAGVLVLGSSQWMQEVERLVGTGDKTGHGPDVGSEEWMYTVSRKVGVFDSQGHGPDVGSNEWQEAVHRLVFKAEPVR